MSQIYFAFIVLPIIILALFIFVFQENTESIAREQLKINCPYPVNSGIANLTAFQNPPSVNYTITHDTDGSDYHVTIFICGDPNPTSVSTSVYTATGTGWFALTDKASGYLFYVSQSISSFFEKVGAGINMLFLILNAPAEVTGLAWFAYVEIVLFAFIGLGIFLMVRGS